MVGETLPDSAPATTLFPQFESQIHTMYSTEVGGLSDPELDFVSDRWEWSRWSIRRTVSHISSGDIRWLVLRWEDQLFSPGDPEVADFKGVLAPDGNPWLDPERYWEIGAVLQHFKKTLGLCQRLLSRETVGSLRSKEIRQPFTDQSKLFSQAHPDGYRQDPKDPSHCFISLLATFRHRYFEYTTHMFNIHRLKKAQGLATRVEVPYEGYWALPGWDRSEP